MFSYVHIVSLIKEKLPFNHFHITSLGETIVMVNKLMEYMYISYLAEDHSRIVPALFQ